MLTFEHSADLITDGFAYDHCLCPQVHYLPDQSLVNPLPFSNIAAFSQIRNFPSTEFEFCSALFV